ncbi:SIS domain-containing protein [Pelosinus sp. UFO1]|uniref:D-sedoheptulose-7-phosphate isomerase n=1 Tax=Pelosinus sp. UFO1 TaxID=484770 RepID=UPI0004D0F239|nr:SIS domain-containing protein [Pelosinus sp. UFO1]AIF50649.1 sugar isomerase (SIS) [Pelosinus sp. UFO1]
MINLYFKQYCSELIATINNLTSKDLTTIVTILWDAYKGNKKIYVIGNGGSAATASHYVCDFAKGTAVPGEKRLKIMSLTDNVAHMTAISNDISYNEVFKEQLENLLEPGDILICISASGNSPNLVQAVNYANSINVTTIGILGFNGGRVKELTTTNIVVDNFNYGQVEDIHLMLGHVLSQYFRKLIVTEREISG